MGWWNAQFSRRGRGVVGEDAPEISLRRRALLPVSLTPLRAARLAQPKNPSTPVSRCGPLLLESQQMCGVGAGDVEGGAAVKIWVAEDSFGFLKVNRT